MGWITTHPTRGTRVIAVTRDIGDAEEAAAPMIITGERTVPGIWHENYWFRRHEVVYSAVTALVADRVVLEAGCGEGYGAALLAEQARVVHALDYDDYAVTHVRRTYPRLPVVRANLVELPLANTTYDVVISLQTIEHLWDQRAFVAECVRVLRPGGVLVISTPNTLTFPPGNVYHPNELAASELRDLVSEHADIDDLVGLHHGAGLARWEAEHGSLVDAQIATSYESWPPHLTERVTSVTTDDFELRSGDMNDLDDLDDLDVGLDLVLVARRRPEATGG